MIGYIDTLKVKFIIDDSEETITHAVELIQIEIKAVEILTSAGNHEEYE